MAMLNDVNVGWDVEKPIYLITALAAIGWRHRMEPGRAFEEKGCGMSETVDRKVSGKNIGFLSRPIVRNLDFSQ